MAKSRKDRAGQTRYQMTVWISEQAFCAIRRKTAEARKKSGVAKLSESAVAGSLLEKAVA